jgi:glycolate oxidase iron-sulfur subunit
VDAKVPRPVNEKTVRWALKEGLPSPLFAPAMKLGQLVRPLLPASLQNKVPPKQSAGMWPRRNHARKVLLLAGCAQPSMSPNIDAATARVLDAAGIQSIVAPKSGCCGAVKFHLNDQDGGKEQMRVNIDAWWPLIAPGSGTGVEALVMNASGCGVTVKEYGHILRDDPVYAAKAARVSELTKDLSEVLPELVPALRVMLNAESRPDLVFHPPCTLQHGQKLRGGVEQSLGELGFTVRLATNESHLCCGSAGTYSVLNPEISYQLRDRKLQNLEPKPAEVIISANIGCITHLQSGTSVPVRHWIEVLDSALISE